MADYNLDVLAELIKRSRGVTDAQAAVETAKKDALAAQELYRKAAEGINNRVRTQSTGDPLMDQVIATTDWNWRSGTDIPSHLLDERAKRANGLNHFEPGLICALHGYVQAANSFGRHDAIYAFICDKTPYTVSENRKEILLHATRAAIVRTQEYRSLDIKVHIVDKIDGPIRWSQLYSGEVPVTGLAGIFKLLSDRPIAHAGVLATLGYEVPPELQAGVDKAHDDIASRAVLKIDEIWKAQASLWKELDALRQKQEQAEEQYAQARAAPVTSLRQVIETDALDFARDALFIKRLTGPNHNDHDRQVQHLASCMQEAIEMGLHKHPRIVQIEIRPGAYRTFDVAKYLTNICQLLELNAQQAEKK